MITSKINELIEGLIEFCKTENKNIKLEISKEGNIILLVTDE